MLDQARNAAGLDGTQPLALRGTGNDARVERESVGRAIDRLVEVGRDLEELTELTVVLGKQVVQKPRSDEHDANLERNRLGLQGSGTEQAQSLSKGLDADAAFEERLLERLPGERRGEQAVCVQNEETAPSQRHCGSRSRCALRARAPRVRAPEG